jgi:hypothetical protein
MALAFKELREEGTRGPCTQDEDSHGFSKLYHSLAGSAGSGERVMLVIGPIASFWQRA